MNMKLVISIFVALAAGLLVAILGGQGSALYSAISVFLLCVLLAYLINWIAFIPAALAQTEKFYDLTGSITYLSVVAIACLLSGPLDLRAILVAAMVAMWSGRLGSFLFKRVHADGGDSRFNKIKTMPAMFFSFWNLQATWVAITAASALLIITSATRLPMDIFGYVGAAIWALGFWIEVVADRQKSAFRTDPANKGRFINVGLWARSRHPNYFGEILLWSGITIMSLPLLSGWQWITLISPVFVAFLLTKVSGIPALSAAGKKRWGDDPEYIAYLANTPALVPKLRVG